MGRLFSLTYPTAAVLLAIVARVIDKVRHRDADQPPPEWPAWGEREATTVST